MRTGPPAPHPTQPSQCARLSCLCLPAVRRRAAEGGPFISLLAGVDAVTPLRPSALLIQQHTPSHALFRSTGAILVLLTLFKALATHLRGLGLRGDFTFLLFSLL